MNAATHRLRDKARAKKALLLAEGEFTSGERCDAVANGARSLLASGLCKGDRVLLLAENNCFWIVTYLSVLRAGVVCVPLHVKDLCLNGQDHGMTPAQLAPLTGLTEEQVGRVYQAIETKRNVAQYLHAAPMLVEPVGGSDGHP